MSDRQYASSPCFAQELAEGGNGSDAVDPQTATDVARWRKATREALIAARVRLSVEEHAETARRVAAALDELVDLAAKPTIAVYWPFRGELDLRDWMRKVVESGGCVALPEVVAKAKPLVFREWTPGCTMRRGVWNILVPDNDTCPRPDVVVSPVVGADPERYRLGYGGGFYDRTLVSLDPRPKVIGVGHSVAKLSTIFPQPHDIPMDEMILADSGQDSPE